MSLGVLVSLFNLFSKDLATSVAADGVKGLFTYRKRRREEKRAQDQYERIIHIESLAERFAEDPSQKVRNLANTLSPPMTQTVAKLLNVTSAPTTASQRCSAGCLGG